ncbi:MAG: exodeoxyribonuclease V subunit beta [Deltaproteobacteria bacterium]|nr:exodeoxyribonuclease V subunit beta [Deltaproteobacteria bacterium]
MSGGVKMEELEAREVELDGTQLIEANAGTGKTFTITTLYLRLVMERDFDVSEIVVVTFTNAAAAELRERIRDRLREAAAAIEHGLQGGDLESRGRDSVLYPLLERHFASGTAERARFRLVRALRSFDEAAIFTIHGFCNAVLQENAFECGVDFETELVGDQALLADQVAQDFWTRALYDASPTFVRWVRGRRRAGQRVSPSLLARLATMVVAKPEMPVLPERADPARDDDLEAHWLAALERVKARWQVERGEVLERLAAAADAGDLSKQIYRPDGIRGNWGVKLDELLAAAAPGFASNPNRGKAPKPWFIRFTRDHVASRTNKKGSTPTHAFFDACQVLADADESYAAALETRWLELELELVAYARTELDRRRRISRTCSYDDLLSVLARALRLPAGEALAERIRTRFRAAMIDEFQDTDPVQYFIFKRIWHTTGAPFFLIGDPKQAIYAFRGADVFAYMEAKADAGAGAHTLSRNWRSDPSLIAAVNRLFERAPCPFLYEQIPFHAATAAPGAKDAISVGGGAGAPLRILHVPRAEPGKPLGKGEAGHLVPPAVAHDIARLLASDATIGDRSVTASDIAVLCRTNAQARDIQSALRDRGIASVMQSQESVFDSPDAEDLERVLAAVADPADAMAVRAAAATPLLGATPESLLALADGDDEEWEPWLQRFRAWHDCFGQEGPMPLLHRIFADPEIGQRLLARTDGERRLTNLLHLGELLQTAARQAGVGVNALLGWLRRMRRDAAARADEAGEAAEIRLESDALAVQIVTIHRSKGLQYGIVYCPYLWDGRRLAQQERDWVSFHDPEDEHRAKLDLGGAQQEAHRHLASWEALAEGMRLLYVALTRAEHRLVVLWGGIKDAELSPLGQLLHPPPADAPLVVSADVDAAEACGAHMQGLDDDGIRDELDALARSSDGCIGVEPLAFSRSDGRMPRTAQASTLRARESRRLLESAWRTSSFSGLVSGHRADSASAADPLAEGLDYDDAESMREDDLLALREPVGATTPVVLNDFPAGAGVGTMIHKIFERLDFAAADPATLRSLSAEELLRHGLSHAWAETLARAVGDVLDSPLGAAVDDFLLRGLTRECRIDEMEFTIPVAGGGTQRLTAGALASVLADRSESASVRAYAQRARSLGFPPLEGYLRGFVDLIFEHAGRFYLVDYKSNQLGGFVRDYRPEALEQTMHAHHYTLQYHLYTLALHRHLGRRLPGYDYDRHIGGVYYLFLRGMAPGHESGSGIHFDRPPIGLIHALSDLFDGRAGDTERAA